jgi:hypothetical protein
MAENLDPEEWAEIMNEAFDYMVRPIYLYEGTVARMMGDGVLAFFGAPIAHEGDPQRAVLAGLEIVRGISTFAGEIEEDYNLDFNVRVGINTGPVVVGDIGSDLALEYTAMGDAINLAARMARFRLLLTLIILSPRYSTSSLWAASRLRVRKRRSKPIRLSVASCSPAGSVALRDSTQSWWEEK